MELFDNLFTKLLDDIKLPHSYYNNICCVRDQILKAQEDLDNKQNELRIGLDKLYAALATEIRKNCPKLSVSINHHGCMISFKSKSIMCKALPFQNKWDFSNDFGKVFSNRYPKCCELECDLAELANCINAHFSYQYRSLE